MLQLFPGGFIKAVEDDTSPKLGGDLDGGGFDISNVAEGSFGLINLPVAAIVGRESILHATISDASGDQWDVFNATAVSGEFSPTFQGHMVTDDDPALTFIGMTDNAHDTGTNPLVLITARKVGNGQDPLNPSGSYLDIATRPIVVIRNRATNLLSIDKDGKIGVGTITQTALLDVNSDIIRLRNDKTPASAGASGNKGDICWDSSYIYVCVATDTWERSALASW